MRWDVKHRPERPIAGIVRILVGSTGASAALEEMNTDTFESMPSSGREIDAVDGTNNEIDWRAGKLLMMYMLSRFSDPIQRALLNASGVAIVVSQERDPPGKSGMCSDNSSPTDKGIITLVRNINEVVNPGEGRPKSSDEFQKAPNGWTDTILRNATGPWTASDPACRHSRFGLRTPSCSHIPSGGGKSPEPAGIVTFTNVPGAMYTIVNRSSCCAS